MAFLGIDYGEKNIGIAVSDIEATLAFPLKVLKNSNSVIREIKEVCQEKEIEAIVLGESLDLSGKPNLIMKDIGAFKELLQSELKKPVFLEPEFYTTAQALQTQGKTKMTDASAAAIILQIFLDRKKYLDKLENFDRNGI